MGNAPGLARSQQADCKRLGFFRALTFLAVKVQDILAIAHKLLSPVKLCHLPQEVAEQVVADRGHYGLRVELDALYRVFLVP